VEIFLSNDYGYDSILCLEERVQRIQEATQRTNEGKEAALILIKQTVPCIMHTENRVGEKNNNGGDFNWCHKVSIGSKN
jgi:hypothetical protein